MDKNGSFLVNVLSVCVKWRKAISFQTAVVGILAIVLSLIVPVSFRGTSRILPPSEDDKASGFSALLSKIPLPSSLLSLGGASEEASLSLAILQSRTVMEAVVQRFGLVRQYKSKNIESAVRILRKRCSFELEEEGTLRIEASASTRFFHPRDQILGVRALARDMTNFFVQQLDSLNRKLRTEKAKNVRLYLEKRYMQNLADMAVAEDQFRAFQEKYGTIALPEQTKAAIEAAAGMKAEIMAKEVEMGVLVQTVGSSHSSTEMAKTKLRELEKQYNDLYQKGDRDGKGIFPPFQKIPEYGVEYVRLYRSIKLQELLLEFLLPQYEQAKIQEAKDTPTIQVIDEAVLPIRKSKPKRFLIVLFSVLFGFVASTVYALWKEHLADIRSRKDETSRKIDWMKGQLQGDWKRIFPGRR